MTHTITVLPSNDTFPIEASETILDAALRANVVLPYGCKDGACGSCKSVIVNGDVVHDDRSNAITDDEKAAGVALLCHTTVTSDVTIEARVISAGTYPIKKLPTRILSMKRATEAGDIMLVDLQLPANDVFEYRGGQYIDFILRDGTRRSYSMACAPRVNDKVLELHIRHMPGGVFTDQLFSSMKERDILRVEGPLGTFFLQDSGKDLIFLASGTGFAPIKAIVEEMQANYIIRPISFYWGVRRPHDLYLNELAEQWARDIPNFKYIPVISDALPEDNWQGRTGMVHQAVMDDFADLSEHDIYACGAPVMVRAAHEAFTQERNLAENSFFSDAFLSAADKSKKDNK
ncbi:CDP-6-deoxy-delta-3,4-glucoseen reductase [Formosimonas limnophila]|uniref:CDP-6-deoxy-delta-3,4-glucoseen reductase n=1 Tax=Formosimonas limnophila TaxID=1384487 RepID=A0A8J3CJT2_9BURK|nr:CDP-6-deoxy-delta-3,4-glucoseen reductase [Formosimonas limnophila]GHA66542.1 CDP-6-deoxy-delta-3,4-glucoseen reductase [Formosimonas limnophila]